MMSGCASETITNEGRSNQGSQADGIQQQDPTQVRVVTTFYPLYDFTQKIGGEYVNVRNLVPAGADPHQWTPSTSDMVQISEADLFIYNGAGFELWTDNVLATLDEDVVVLEAVQHISLLHVNEAAHESDEDGDHQHGEFDPHVWVSPKRALQMAENIKDSLVQIAPHQKKYFDENFAVLQAELEKLDHKLTEVAANRQKDYVVVSHNALAYVAHDYGFEQRFIMGLSPEAEPTIQHLGELAQFIEEQDIQYILFEELASPKVAETLAKDIGIEMLVFHPLEGLTKDQEQAGEDYLTVMEQNINTIEKALQ